MLVFNRQLMLKEHYHFVLEQSKELVDLVLNIYKIKIPGGLFGSTGTLK